MADDRIALYAEINALLPRLDRMLEHANAGDAESYYRERDALAADLMGQAEARRVTAMRQNLERSRVETADEGNGDESPANRVKALAEARRRKMRDEIPHKVLAFGTGLRRITCPFCQKPDVALHKNGKLRPHKTPGGHRCPPEYGFAEE